MPHRGDATEGESSLAASGAGMKGLGDAGYPGMFPAMRMQLHLEDHSLCDAIESETIARKKDWQALSVMLGAMSEDIHTQLDITKMTKETWELFKATYVRVTPTLGRFDPITASLKQFSGIDSMPFEEVVGSLKIYEEKLKSCQQKKEEQGGNPHDRGRGRGRGHG
ncbi:unnamed protein product [Spirodela intermedia]|uniref:Uncharacterized protein n=1 Tax=Spirodela intermedia TaxID=51605 RepID=A0A7I8JJ27_SPIIN|nr:unnamed protein product [Spirodela intermedia]CAA6669422.1 unnamed protein product [Spirodela intermedia]